MYNDEEFALTADERTALASLRRAMPTGDLLEARVLSALREQGYFDGTRATLRHSQRSTLSITWRVAAAIALFAGGVATGRYVLASGAPESAAISAPASIGRDMRDTTPRTETRPARQNETVVAEREMWL